MLLPVDFLEKIFEAVFKFHGGYNADNAKEFNQMTVIIHNRGFTDRHLITMAFITEPEYKKLTKEYEDIRNRIF